jgi:hypothetical protein
MDVYINGIWYRAQRDFTITEQTGNKTMSDISVLVESQPAPVAGDAIDLKDGEKTVFWGTCGIPKSPKYISLHEPQIYQIACNNANSILANRIINVAYQDYTITEIVNSLFTQYISQENILVGQISDIPVKLEVYTAGDFNLQTALNELADLVGATWKVSNDHRFYFIAKEDFPSFPHVINKDFLLGGEMQHTTKDYQTRTVQYVTGATDITSQQTEYFTYDGEQKSFTTVFPLARKPTVYVNGTQIPPDRIGINGIDDEDPDVVLSFAYDSQTVSIKEEEYFKTGDSVQIDYIGMFPIRVVAYNQNKISEIAAKTGTSGRREQVYLASDVTTTADALQLANSLLTQFEEATGEIKFWLTSAQLESLGMVLDHTEILTQITFALPEIHIVGDYIITERTLSPFSADASVYKIELTLRDRNYLKSYAETISDLYRDINQLYIRQDDIVIQQNSLMEAAIYSENTIPSVDLPLFNSSVIINGCPFAGFDFDGVYYPSAAGPLSGAYGPETPHYPINAVYNGSMFAPIDLSVDIYPTE